MYENNSIVLHLQVWPWGTTSEVIGYTEAEIYVKRNGKRDWYYCIKTHLVTRIETDIPMEEIENRSFSTKIVKKEGKDLILKVISLNGDTEYEGRVIKIETKTGLIPDFEFFFDKFSGCVNKIRSINGDKNLTPEQKEELLSASKTEMNKLIKVLEIASPIIDEKELKVMLSNLDDLKSSFHEEAPVQIPQNLLKINESFEQCLREINHFNKN